MNGVSSYNFIRDFTYLTVRYSAILVLVKFLHELVDFLLTHIETSGFNESSEFLLSHSAIIVEVATDEGLVEVETWPLGKSLSQAFRVSFNLEVHSPEVLEFNLCLS